MRVSSLFCFPAYHLLFGSILRICHLKGIVYGTQILSFLKSSVQVLVVMRAIQVENLYSGLYEARCL